MEENIMNEEFEEEVTETVTEEAPAETGEPVPEEVEVIGIRFKTGGKTYYFDPDGAKFTEGTYAIVETARGLEYGYVSQKNTVVSGSEIVPPLRKAIRSATAEDKAHYEENQKKEDEAFTLCAEQIERHKLGMKLVDAEYTFDNSKLLFYFSAEGRVDFRELVKDLASIFRTRIELRQIGIRDEAKMIGGFGVCGRPFCCSTFLPDFAQVSIKMAKEQNLSLNSSKISGACGRLMCCLRYEHETYEEAIQAMPRHGATVYCPEGEGVVIETQPLAALVKIKMTEDESKIKTWPLSDISDKPLRRERPPRREKIESEAPAENKKQDKPPRERKGDRRPRHGKDKNKKK